MAGKRILRTTLLILRGAVAALVALAAATLLVYAAAGLVHAPPAPPGKSYVSLGLAGQTAIRPPLSVQLDLALMVGAATLLAALGLAWIMIATQKQLRSAMESEGGLYGLILDLHERIKQLETEVRELRQQGVVRAPGSSSRTSWPGASAPAPATSRLDADTRDAPADLWSGRREGATTASPHRHDPFSSGSPAPQRALSYDLERLSQGETYAAVMRDYERALHGAVGKFEQRHAPTPANLAADGGLRVSGDPDLAPFWFVPIGEALGVLLPSGAAMRQWSEMFQYLGGKPARETFGIAYEVDGGDSLAIVRPAWVERSGERLEVQRKGSLRGA